MCEVGSDTLWQSAVQARLTQVKDLTVFEVPQVDSFREAEHIVNVDSQ